MLTTAPQLSASSFVAFYQTPGDNRYTLSEWIHRVLIAPPDILISGLTSEDLPTHHGQPNTPYHHRVHRATYRPGRYRTARVSSVCTLPIATRRDGHLPSFLQRIRRQFPCSGRPRRNIARPRARRDQPRQSTRSLSILMRLAPSNSQHSGAVGRLFDILPSGSGGLTVREQ